jgi:hypothetical protein
MNETEQNDKSSRALLALLVAVLPALAPTLAGAVTLDAIGEGYCCASADFYAVAAQVLPVLLLVLALERNYFFRVSVSPPHRRRPSRRPRSRVGGWSYDLDRKIEPYLDRFFGPWLLVFAQVLVGILVAYGEFRALQALATGKSDHQSLEATAVALSSAFAAVVAAALVTSLEAGLGRRPASAENDEPGDRPSAAG